MESAEGKAGIKKKNLIVFDIDGTLTESVEIHQKAFSKALLEIGVKNIHKEFGFFKHHTDSFIAKEIYENDCSEKFNLSKFNEFERLLTNKVQSERINEVKGAKKIIEDLNKNTDFGICFATGSLLRPAIFKLQSINLEFNNELLVASDDIYEREQIVSKAIERAKKFFAVDQFDKIISIGDGLWDLITANNLNIEFIGVGKKNKDVLQKHGAENIIKDLTDLKMILQ